MSFDGRGVGFATASEFVRIEERADERIRVEVRLGKRLAHRTAPEFTRFGRVEIHQCRDPRAKER